MHYNVTFARNATIELGWYHRMKFVVLITMFILSLGTNIFVLSFAYRVRRIKSTLNILIIHLCWSDILVAMLCMFGECLWIFTIQWYAPGWLCKLYKFSISFSISLSTGIVCIMSIDRTLVVIFPLRRSMMASRVKQLIVLMYLGSGLINISQITMFDIAQAPPPYPLPFIQCVHISLFTPVPQWKLKTIFWVHYLFNYVLPLVIIAICYSLILYRLRDASRLNQLNESSQRSYFSKPSITITISKDCSTSLVNGKHFKEKHSIALFSNAENSDTNQSSSKTARSISTHSRVNLFRRARKKSIKLSFSIIFTFLVCWTPYYLVYFIRSYNEPVHRFDPRDPAIYSFFFGHMNGIINPIICGVFQLYLKFRKH